VRSAFPDLTLTADEVVAASDRVAILWTMSGTHQGEFLGAPPTGNSIATSGIDIYRIANGQIAEIWTVGDDLGWLFQLGTFPAFEHGAEATPGA
jgi:predicted ester cyclase